MTENPYQSGTLTSTPAKTRATRWLVWFGVGCLSLAALCLVATMLAFDAVTNSSPSSTPSDVARGFSIATLPSLGVVPLSALGIVLLIAGFLVRQPTSNR